MGESERMREREREERERERGRGRERKGETKNSLICFSLPADCSKNNDLGIDICLFPSLLVPSNEKINK